MKRPHPTWEEYKFLTDYVTNASGLCITANKDDIVSKFRNNSSNEGILSGVSYSYKDVYELTIEEGRYFTKQESVGVDPWQSLDIESLKIYLNDLDPVGKAFKIKGISFYTIGKLKEEGEGFLEMDSKDDQIIIPYSSFTKLYYIGKGNKGLDPYITLKGYESDLGLISNLKLKD